MSKTHQEFMSQFDDERKPLVAALLAAIVEECPGLSEPSNGMRRLFAITAKTA